MVSGGAYDGRQLVDTMPVPVGEGLGDREGDALDDGDALGDGPGVYNGVGS